MSDCSLRHEIAYLAPSTWFRSTEKLSYRVVVKWGSSTMRGSWSSTRIAPRIIWQGTDDYVNVCINDGLETYSKNGRLYCTVQGYAV